MTNTRNAILAGIFALAMGAACVYIMTLAPTAAAQDTEPVHYLRWTDASGRAHFTDKLESVPMAYRASVQELKWSDLETSTDRKMTPITSKKPTLRPNFQADPGQPEEISCLPLRVEEKWSNENGIMRRTYLLLDNCGTLLSVSPSEPKIRVQP